MAKGKGNRISINLKCIICNNRNDEIDMLASLSQTNLSSSTFKRRNKKSVYRSTKNRQNTKERLELRKFCRVCNSHCTHIESK